ncbi:hypothetical protein [Clostridium felsineum]|uniref:hypothetical protein n=1 Tax=Clostridium felsineum TaxID=36839 RepID=UPI001591AE63|nr:hypothetical protein [Clostridium felsineum]
MSYTLENETKYGVLEAYQYGEMFGNLERIIGKIFDFLLAHPSLEQKFYGKNHY